MARRVTPAQFQAMLRQLESQQRRAVNDYNSAARKYNAAVKKAVDEHNANVRRAQSAADRYNREARAHNARVRANQQRLRSEVARLNLQPAVVTYEPTRTSSIALHAAYQRVEADYDGGRLGPSGAALADLAEAEAANSAAIANVLHGALPDDDPEDSSLTDELSSLSQDFDSRWRGALFALSPRNPDAARHFCTSAREIIAGLIDLKARDSDVLAANSVCETTKDGRPLRREKINYLLTRAGVGAQSMVTFVDSDIDDVLNLFRVFNTGTHGPAGTMDLTSLRTLKRRIEGAIRFLSKVVRATP